VKRGTTIALAVGAVVLVGGGLFFANEANLFPRESRAMRSFDHAEKIWGAGDYVCARIEGQADGLRCALRGIGRDSVENAITVSFLSNPTALISDAPHLCALEHGEVQCWDMATPILSGLGLMYSPQQEQAGTINHGTLSGNAVSRVPMQGTVKALVKHELGFCALADDGISCFKFKEPKDRAPEKRWSTKGKTLTIAGDDLLCTEEADALQCFSDPALYTVGGRTADSPMLAMKVRVDGVGAKDVTAVAASGWAFCTLSGGAVACAKRVNSGASPALEELKLAHVDGLKSPTKIWSSALDILALDGDRIIQLDDRNGFALKVWGTLGHDEEVHTDTRFDWFLYRNGNLVRSPNGHWPIKYDVGGKPSQVISLDLDTCALVGGRAMCFDY
jgi:hypothetical protein